jgi:probable O-glycosylation ligase (exosortase A-associated)
MRDLIIAGIVVAALAKSFSRPWLGALLWTWLSVNVPHKLCYGFARSAPFAALAAVVTVISLFTASKQVKLPRQGAVYLMLAFVAWMGLSTAMAIHPDQSMDVYIQVVKVLMMAVVAMSVLREERHIRWFVWVDALSIGFYGFKGGLFTIRTGGGGTMIGPGGFMTDNNLLALSMIMTVPLLHFLARTTPHPKLKRLLQLTLLLTVVAAIGTYSRGAFLSVAAMGLAAWWRSKARVRWALFVVCLAVALAPAMPDKWTKRMDTINSYDEDTSAMGRIFGWLTAINIAKDRITGAGFQAYTHEVVEKYGPPDMKGHGDVVLVAHSVWFQVLGQHGYIGLAMFMGLWLLGLRKAAWIKKTARGRPHLQNCAELASMCQIAFLGFFVGGSFLSFAYADLQYNLLVMLVATQAWMERNLEAPQSTPAGGTPARPAAPARSQRVPQGLPHWQGMNQR